MERRNGKSARLITGALRGFENKLIGGRKKMPFAEIYSFKWPHDLIVRPLFSEPPDMAAFVELKRITG